MVGILNFNLTNNYVSITSMKNHRFTSESIKISAASELMSSEMKLLKV